MEEILEEEKKEEKKEKKKKKIKVKKKGLLIGIMVFLLVLIGGSIIGYHFFEKETVSSIQKKYNEKVITTKNTKLYNKKGKEIGSITKDYALDLEKVKITSLKNRYLQIKDSDYYVSYKDIKKRKETEEKKEDSYYLPLEKEITSKDSVVLYDGNKEIITLKNGITTPINKMDDENYYVTFLGRTLKVPKSKKIKEQDTKITLEEKPAEHVSVIYYDKIQNDCGADDTCLMPASVRSHITHMQKAGYYFITKEDYVSYIKGYIRLKEKAVFLAIGNPSEEANQLKENLKVDIGKIEENDGIKLVVTNKTSTPSDDKNNVNCYQAKSYTIIDNYAAMAYGADMPDNGKETPNNQGIAVLNYHFFYDQTIPGESDACHESICLEREKFKSHLQWLKDNGYKTLTIEEFADWMDGIIEVPEKSVLLTIDDGAHGTGAHNGNVLIPLLEEYQEYATLFLITGWWGLENYQSPYLDVQSHTNNLHYEAQCADGRGKVACSDYQTVYDDIKTSIDVLQDNTSFCFPFYSADREGIQAVKDLGFRVSFVGGSVKSRRSNNHYLIPRYPIMDDITLNEFISMVS